MNTCTNIHIFLTDNKSNPKDKSKYCFEADFRKGYEDYGFIYVEIINETSKFLGICCYAYQKENNF